MRLWITGGPTSGGFWSFLLFLLLPSHEVTMRYPKTAGTANQTLPFVSGFLVDIYYSERKPTLGSLSHATLHGC